MRYTENFGEIIRKIESASRETAHEIALEATDIIAKSFAEDKSGEIYDYGQASAPGEEPAINTGDLLDSLGVSRVGQTTYQFGAKDEKAEMLENGTVFMEPRPFIAPLEKPLARKFKQKARDKIGQAVRGF
jgi:hypothetical protein